MVNKLDAVDTFLRSVDGKSTLVADMKPPMQAVESAIAPSKLEAIRKLQLSVSDMESQNLSLQSIIEAQKDDLIRRCRRATDKQLLFDTVFDQILSTAKTAELETLVDRMINL